MYTNIDSVSDIQKTVQKWRDARCEYEEVRSKVMRKITQFLKETKKAFTAVELSEKFGLSPAIITKMAHQWYFYIDSRDRYTEVRLAPLNEYNEPDLNNIKVIHTKCKEYFYNNPRSFP